MLRMRITYTKSKEAAYILPEDLKIMIGKLLVRIGVSIKYTKDGMPNIILANSLPLGVESLEEICDVLLDEYIDTVYVVKCLNQIFPSGMIAMSAEYISEEVLPIDMCTYGSEYEIMPLYENIDKLTNREFSDLRAWYKRELEEYLDEAQILVLVKAGDRCERIDIRPNIIEYNICLNDALQIKIKNTKDYIFHPNYIMEGFLEHVEKKIKYSLKRIKILHN